jgi:hypothetical protein
MPAEKKCSAESKLRPFRCFAVLKEQIFVTARQKSARNMRVFQRFLTMLWRKYAFQNRMEFESFHSKMIVSCAMSHKTPLKQKKGLYGNPYKPIFLSEFCGSGAVLSFLFVGFGFDVACLGKCDFGEHRAEKFVNKNREKSDVSYHYANRTEFKRRNGHSERNTCLRQKGNTEIF